MTVHEELRSGLHDHYRGLLPNGLAPRRGGKADELVDLVAEVAATEITAALSMLLAWFPQTSEEDALAAIGEARSLRRFPREPLDIWRQRVLGAADFWALGGTLPGVQLALAQAGYRAVIIEHFREPDQARWAEFSVVVGPLEALKAEARWGEEGGWGGGKAWGFRLPAVPLDSLVELIREVKPAHARLRRLTWSPRGRYWGGGVKWGEGRDGTPPALQPGWGVQTGYLTPPDVTRTDNGPAWGESDNEIIYELGR